MTAVERPSDRRVNTPLTTMRDVITWPFQMIMAGIDRLLNVSDRMLAILLLLPAAVLILGFAIFPTLQGAYTSLFRVNSATLEMTFTGVLNYERLLSNPEFWASTYRTLVLVVVTVGVQTVLGLGISMVLHQNLWGRNIARGLVLFPYLMPAVVIALTWRFMFDPTLGIINRLLSQWGLIEQPIAFLASTDTAMWMVIIAGIWKYTPFMIIMFLARLQVIPPEQIEAAQLDGANTWQVFRYVTLPWLMPVLIVALLLRTIWTFNEFEMVYLFAFGGPLNATTTLPVLVRQLAFDARNLGEAAATATMMVAILLVAAYGYFKLYERAERDLND